eukprot:EG_transcript_39590
MASSSSTSKSIKIEEECYRWVDDHILPELECEPKREPLYQPKPEHRSAESRSTPKGPAAVRWRPPTPPLQPKQPQQPLPLLQPKPKLQPLPPKPLPQPLPQPRPQPKSQPQLQPQPPHAPTRPQQPQAQAAATQTEQPHVEMVAAPPLPIISVFTSF